MVEDLQLLAKSNDIYMRVFYPIRLTDFYNIFHEITRCTPIGIGAVVHFDMHGCQKKGVLVDESREYLPWAALARMLATLNLKTRNNLLVLFPVCFGFQLALQIDITKNSPFFVFITAEKEINSGFITDNFTPFYRDVLSTADLTASYNNNLASNMKLVHSDRVFLIAMIRYFKRRCIGKGGKVRREELLTAVLNGGAESRHSRRSLRKKIRNHIVPKKETFEKYKTIFLCGKNSSYSFEDVMSLVRN